MYRPYVDVCEVWENSLPYMTTGLGGSSRVFMRQDDGCCAEDTCLAYLKKKKILNFYAKLKTEILGK